ncbi:MAG TPA: EndoU domain-containing protein [Bacillota bacterium]|nr:EndoU domain-containing protein [Bacillota bacterium]
MKKIINGLLLLTLVIFLTSCDLDIIDDLLEETSDAEEHVILIEDLKETGTFRDGALEHILEGEINGKGQATGFHYDQLPTKKGEIIEGTETSPNEYGVYEAQVKVGDVEKTSNRGFSSFFPDEWNTQRVVDAINEAYDTKAHLTGNTYEGISDDGVSIQMYLDNNDKIISAFPVYE